MRIVLVAERLSTTGGAELSTLQVSRELAHRGHDIHLLFEQDGNLYGDYRTFCRSMTRAHTTFWRDRWPYHLARITPSVLKGVSHRPDVVYLQRFRDLAFGGFVSRLARAPLVCHLRGYGTHYSSVPQLGRLADRFICVSSEGKKFWSAEGLPESRITIIHNGIEPSEYPPGGLAELAQSRQELGLPLDSFVVLYYGRVDEQKGVDILLDAWRRLGMAPDEGRLVILGSPMVQPDPDAYLRYLQQLAPPGCLWIPMQRHVINVLHAADVVVLPSRIEGFGRTVIEGMATGRPVVGSRVGGIAETLDGPFARFTFEAGDAQALAERLSGLIDWRTREPELAQKCTDYVRDKFTLQGTVDGVERVLTEVVADPLRRPGAKP
jgi:glycosyltransferase involved in cell wall biosynthesis